MGIRTPKIFCKAKPCQKKSIIGEFAKQTKGERSEPSPLQRAIEEHLFKRTSALQFYSPNGEFYCYAVIFSFQPSDIACGS